MIYNCCNDNRKAAVLNNPTLNGIDYLEVLDQSAVNNKNTPVQQTLLVYCLKPVSLPDAQPPGYLLIQGGESITDVSVEWAAPASLPPTQANNDEKKYFAALANNANVLVVRTNKAGDFSTYTLRLVNDAGAAAQDPFAVTSALAGFDPQLCSVDFSFKVECGPEFDCAPQTSCPPDQVTPPPINYLAKDYGSFRQIMLDRMSQLAPAWSGSGTEADLGVVLAELIAYTGDRLSYWQDAVATEAYIETARSRISLRRHARLVGYPVQDGCNARAWVQVPVQGNPGEQVFLDRTLTRFYTSAPGMPSNLNVGSGNEESAVIAGLQVFEPMWDAVLYPELNRISFYTWGDLNCCLPEGATEATLLGSFPNLQTGDVLIFQEVKGPRTGVAADADIRHRCAVRLTQVATLVDPLFSDATGKPIAVTEIQWAQNDALKFPVCISSTYLDSGGDTQTVTDVSVVLGNIVGADHGLSFTATPMGTVPGPLLFYPSNPAADRCSPQPPSPLPVRFRPTIPDSPVTQAVPLSVVPLPAVTIPVTAGVVLLGGADPVSLEDAAGFSCLTLQATNPAAWPQYFGAVAAAGGTPVTFNVSIVYNPPSGAPGIQKQVVLEVFSGLSLTSADPNYALTRINAQSRFVRVPAYWIPGTLPATYSATPVMFSNAGAVDLPGGSPALPFLTLQPLTPIVWPSYFGVRTIAGNTASSFELQVLYNPPSGIGVTLPVLVEDFPGLTLATAATDVNGTSSLLNVTSYAQTADTSLAASDIMTFQAGDALPEITLTATLVDGLAQTWTAKQDLLEDGESDPVFVVEVDTDGTAKLRFGDNTNGKTPDEGTSFTAGYRIGNGTAGNVGADSLINVAAGDARIQACTNPLPAGGGTDPETNDQIRRRAPQAFLTQERAVTMADYENVAEQNPQVDRAVASLRWTGSWYTVFIAAEPTGGGNLTPALSKTIKAAEERYRLAGQDLELESPQYVSLEIELIVCVDPSYFMSYVQQGLMQVLGSQLLPNGQKGLFYPDNFSFGQTVYLSSVYAAARTVAGVVAVTAKTFQPQGVDTPQYINAGEIPLGPLQIARLDNNPNYPDHGRLTLDMEGGR